MAVTPTQYRHHRTLCGPFLSGEIAGVAGGLQLADNPYRRKAVGRNPTRGRWSEAYIRAWAIGWREGDTVRQEAARRLAEPATTKGADG
jgi:hypothetical protein